MANNCYNIFKFFGNSKVQIQIKSWRSRLKERCSSSSDPKSGLIIFDVFFPGENITDANLYLGVKWAYPDFGETIPLEPDELGFVSAWSAMDGFQDHLTEKLKSLDKNVVVLLTSNNDSFQESARYTAVAADDHICAHSIALEFKGQGDNQEPNYTLYFEHQLDSCEDLIDAVPGTKKNLKSHVERLEQLFDESLRR